MLKIALCDDEEIHRAAVIPLLREYAAAHPELAVRLAVFSSPYALLDALEEKGAFDLYLLDVVMPGLSGIELGLRLRELDSSGLLVYLTVSPEFAVDSYAARAFHYLIKPVDAEQLHSVLDSAAAKLERQRAACITIKMKDGLRRVRLDDIQYAELTGRTVRYHLADGEQLDSVTVRGAFHDVIAPLLASSQFVQCGASFAANLFYITAVEKNCFLLEGGQRIPLSRALAAQAKQKWLDYWMDGAEKDCP